MQVKKIDFIDRATCPVIKALDEIGDRWILMILRECFHGIKRFEDFQQNLNISRSVLTQKLQLMIDRGFLEKKPYKEDQTRVRQAYHLTKKGKGLHKILSALLEWGNDYLVKPGEETQVLISPADGKAVRLAYKNQQGQVIDPKTLIFEKKIKSS